MKYFINFILAFAVLFAPTSFSWAALPIAQQQDLQVSYLSNGGFENGASGYKAYKGTAQAIPVTGAGGSPSVTIAASTSSPLSGKSSGVFTHPASNTQGEGFALPFTVDPAGRAKVLTITGVYQVISGIYSGGSSSTDSDVEVYVYDVDAAQVIQPSGFKLDGGVSGITYNVNATFQTSSTSTNYKLIIHSATATATAYSLKFDQFQANSFPRAANSLRPQLMGTVVIAGCASTFQLSSTVYADFGVQTGCTYTTSGQAQAPSTLIPAIKFANLPAGDYRIEYEGGVQQQASGVYSFFQFSDGTNTAREASSIYSGAVNAIVPGISQTISYLTSQSNVQISLKAKSASGAVNISGTTSNPGVIKVWYTPSIASTTNDLGDQRIVLARVSGAHNAATSGNPIINASPSPFYDTHGAYSTTTGKFTCPVPGYYEVKFYVNDVANVTYNLYKNGSSFDSMGFSGAGGILSSSNIVQCIAGDTLDIRPNVTLTNGNPNSTSFTKIQGPSQIAPTETIAASYWLSAAFTASTTIPINFDSKEYDTHNAVTTSSTVWKFTAPASGLYSIKGLYNGSNSLYVNLYKNNSAYKSIGYSTAPNPSVFVGSIRLNAGDYIDVRPNTSSALIGGALNSLNGTMNISIERIGL
jgi:hypothetical protein